MRCTWFSYFFYDIIRISFMKDETVSIDRKEHFLWLHITDLIIFFFISFCLSINHKNIHLPIEMCEMLFTHRTCSPILIYFFQINCQNNRRKCIFSLVCCCCYYFILIPSQIFIILILLFIVQVSWLWLCELYQSCLHHMIDLRIVGVFHTVHILQ